MLMNAGRAEQIGTPKQLYDAPATVFAAGFIGTPPMNLLPASDVTVPADIVGNLEISDLLVGVRPESMIYPEQNHDLSATCRVTSVEYEGSVFLVHLVSPSGSPFILSHSGENVPVQGDEITVGWTRATTHLFSKTTGQRVPPAP